MGKTYPEKISEAWSFGIDDTGAILSLCSNDNVRRKSGQNPDSTLYEEFDTRDYVVKSPPHGTPEVYNKEGILLGKLTSDAELAYVTQVGEYLVAEFDTENGEQFGQLIDKECKVLADYPDISELIISSDFLIT